MKKTVTLALTLALVLGLLSGCANNDTPADNAENSKAAETAENFTDEMKIPYAVDLSPEDGTELEGYPGTTLDQAIDIFNGVGGFDIISSNDYPDGIWLDDIQGWLSEGKPVMICWNDWGGHWQTIIGYDTMGTENENDDVFLVADSYDTTDHNQDGYGIYPAERLMYNFTMYGAFPESEGGSDMLFLVASPSAK